LGHIAAIPVIVDRKDAVVLDHQVHTSVRLATDIVSAHGTYVETIRHNRMDKLEERILELSKTYDKIWYMADGIYSMYGDSMPVKAVEALLNKYDNFRLYVDDAHGMGVFGENGKGYVLNEMDYHKNLFLATSLGKGFGSGGGVLVCPDELTKEQILFTGSTLIFTSPPEPSILGSIIKATEIHQSPKGDELRDQLRGNLEHFYSKAEGLDLPLINKSRTPIAFIAAGNPEMVTGICHRMLQRGYHITPGVYPATSYNNGGVRIVLSLYQSKDNIDRMLEVLKEEYENMLLKYDTSVEKILSYYKK
jgi:7-keto-8-aminopelargonate synthetase-like enzyme